MTKMTDAFKKIFLDLGGNPKELAENNDVGDYILDLESAIKAYVNEAASGGDKVIFIEVDWSSSEILSIHLKDSDIDITSPSDISNYIKEGYSFILRRVASDMTSRYYPYSYIHDDPYDDLEMYIYFYGTANNALEVFIDYADGSRSVREVNT